MTYLRRAIYKQGSMAADEANFDLGFDVEDDENEDRFASKSEKEKDDLMGDRHRQNTKRATKNSIKILIDYLKEKKLPPLTELTDEDLPNILYDFYCNLRKVKGGSYKLQTLKCI